MVLITIIATAFILRRRKRSKPFVPEAEPDTVEDHPAAAPPPKPQNSPAPSIERTRQKAFNPYPGPNDNPQ